mmetsp:Transcript_44893/g.80868  ORF Transcript_44893/g.80868 Transcript_44893/m.80868 type:complete len:201 (+) Transcript_44893:492-1094(+)
MLPQDAIVPAVRDVINKKIRAHWTWRSCTAKQGSRCLGLSGNCSRIRLSSVDGCLRWRGQVDRRWWWATESKQATRGPSCRWRSRRLHEGWSKTWSTWRWWHWRKLHGWFGPRGLPRHRMVVIDLALWCPSLLPRAVLLIETPDLSIQALPKSHIQRHGREAGEGLPMQALAGCLCQLRCCKCNNGPAHAIDVCTPERYL